MIAVVDLSARTLAFLALSLAMITLWMVMREDDR